MSGVSISPYLPFRRIKIVKQDVEPGATQAVIDVVPDLRFQPVCHVCGRKAPRIHSWAQRSVRDLNLASTRVWLRCGYRKLLCRHCQRVSIEELGVFHPYLRVTRRLAVTIHQLCTVMTVSDVARHFQLDWKTVKDIDKQYLEAHYGQPDLSGLRVLAVDEISIRKGHSYLTVVLDYETGRVVYVGKDRKAKTLSRFFNQLTGKQRKAVEAVAMDMCDPYIKAVKKNSRMPRSSSTSSTSSPPSVESSTKSATANTARPLPRTKRSLRAPSTCC
ncbi:MAG: transposase [Deltaproteobacteria bacterium]|nr:transposase [Deltaproteobacteria bacterium]